MRININQELIEKIQKGIKLNLYRGALIGTILTTTVGPAMIPTQNASAAEITQEYNDANTMINNMALSALATTTSTTSSKKTEVTKKYLTAKELNNKISSLQKKYKKMNKDEIKALVVGANLDNIKDDVLFKVLGVKSKKDLTKWADKLESAVKNLMLNRARWHHYNNELRDVPPTLKYGEMPKLQELLFEEDVITHVKTIEKLIENVIKVNKDFEKARRSKITLIGFYYDYYDINFPKYMTDGLLFDFEDPELGDSVNYIINCYLPAFVSGTAIQNSNSYAPVDDPESEMLKYSEEYLKNYNPFEIRATLQKKGQYLTVRELNDRIKKLQKKYRNMNKDEIKALVVGTNLDYIEEDVLMKVLGAKTKSDLTKWSNRFEKALKNKTQIAINWHLYKMGLDVEYPSLEYDEVVKLQDFAFDKEVIRHFKDVEGLIEIIATKPKKDDKTTQSAFITAISHFYNLDSKEGLRYKFNDKKLGDSSNFVINYYLSKFIGSTKLKNSSTNTIVDNPQTEMIEYADELITNSNPFKFKIESVKAIKK